MVVILPDFGSAVCVGVFVRPGILGHDWNDGFLKFILIKIMAFRGCNDTCIGFAEHFYHYDHYDRFVHCFFIKTI